MLGFRSFPTSFSFRRKLCFSILARVTDPSISDRVAIVEPSGATFTFGQLHQASSNLAAEILKQTASKPTTIACFQSSGASYVISSLATWKLGATLVPLSPLHTPLELDFFLSDSDTELILCSKDLTTKLDTISRQKLVVRIDLSSTAVISTTDHSSSSDTNALMIYTSGTTGKPKGVIHTHESINHMIQSLTTAWQYSETDRILHFLPLHHLHGILNKLWCVLSVGGMVEFLKSSNPIEIWERLSNPPHVTLFMAVPTIYSKMLDLYDRKVLPTKVFETAITNMGALRLMVSGSASLPIPILRRWRELTGHHLLERYGMTEVGMVLSNPLYGERKEGYVGTALPNVECRVIHDPDYIGDNSNAAVECGELVLKVWKVIALLSSNLLRERRYSNHTIIAQKRLGWPLTKMVGLKLVILCFDTFPKVNSFIEFSVETPPISLRFINSVDLCSQL